MRILEQRKALLILAILAVLVLAAPSLIRLADGNLLPYGQEPYYHAKISESLLQDGFSSDYPYHLLLALLGLAFPSFFIALALPVMLGIVSLLLYYAALKRFDMDKRRRTLSCFILIFSPIFLYASSSSNQHILGAVLLLGAFNLFTKKKRILFALSLPLLLLVALSGVLPSLILGLLLISYKRHNPSSRTAWPFSLLVFLLSLAVGLFYYSNLGFFPYTERAPGIIAQSIWDIGGTFGYTFIVLFLFGIGLMVTWKRKRKYVLLYLTLAFLLTASAYSQHTNIYTNFLVSALAGIGLTRLLSMRWELAVLKKTSLAVIVLAVLIAGFVQVTLLADEGPDSSTSQALNWLEQNSDPSAVIISYPSRGSWIEYFAGRKAVVTGLYPSSKPYQKASSDIYTLFTSRNLDEAKDLLTNYSVSHLYIDQDIYLDITGEQEGIFFLFRNNETFKKGYNHTGIQIWQFIGEER